MEGYDYYDIDEVEQLLADMDEDAMLKCVRAAIYFVNQYDLPMEGEDLFHEAIKRLYEGKRKLPKDVHIATAINQIIKSISYDMLTQRRDEPMRTAIPIENLSTVPDIRAHSSADIETRWQRILCIFSDDEAATALLRATENGLKKAEIVNDVFDGNSTEYSTTRRRIIRNGNTRVKGSS